MNFKKIANRKHEEIGAATSKDLSRHGYNGQLKKLVNRAAKRLVARRDLKEQAE